MCDVSVIIVNWNTCSDLKVCLDSIQSSVKTVDYEVIVVDNASEDHSVDMIRKEFTHVHLICNKQNEGFAKANNQAMAISKGRYILYVNSNVIVMENTIDKFVAYADKNPQVGAFGCRILNNDRTLQRSCYHYPTALGLFFSSLYLSNIFPKSRIFGREQYSRWDFSQKRKVAVVKGCFMLVPQRVIQEIGMFDDRFFMFCEEADLCYRIQKAGYEVMYNPFIEVVHAGQASVKKALVEMKVVSIVSKLLFIQNHYNKIKN